MKKRYRVDIWERPETGFAASERVERHVVEWDRACDLMKLALGEGYLVNVIGDEDALDIPAAAS